MAKAYGKAVRAKCKDCIYDPLAGGTWLKQVENCNVYYCPLWVVRPITRQSRLDGLKAYEIDKMREYHLERAREKLRILENARESAGNLPGDGEASGASPDEG